MYQGEFPRHRKGVKVEEEVDKPVRTRGENCEVMVVVVVVVVLTSLIRSLNLFFSYIYSSSCDIYRFELLVCCFCCG